MKRILFLIFLFCVCSIHSQETYMYRLILKDKGNPPFSLSNPEAFLSQKSIERRSRQGLNVNESDLPIDPAYFEAITNTGAHIQSFSKWVNTVVVHLSGLDLLPELENLSFVDSLYCVWKGVSPPPQHAGVAPSAERRAVKNDINSYGNGFTQISLNNGHLLHEAGFRGQGMTIAVVDGGFTNADISIFFDQSKIIEVKNFHHGLSNPLREENQESSDHGTRVLSCMLSNRPGEMIGTAPEAEYYLFRSEVIGEEFPVEEDYWVAAVEYADSLGIDIVTSSLGYSTFNDSEMNHNQSESDGQTAPISRAASMAASKGILLFNSAGNEGNGAWRKILFPADASNMLTIGNIGRDSIRSSTSSVGYSADGRIKPDLMAMGSQVCVVGGNGSLSISSGTSLSTPILAGLSACLWGALPDLTSFEIIELLRETAHQYLTPDSEMGYGIADVYKAYNIGSITGLNPAPVENRSYLSLNLYENRLHINLDASQDYAHCTLNIYSGLGMRMISLSKLSDSIDISFLPQGIYIVHLQIGNSCHVRKFIKL